MLDAFSWTVGLQQTGQTGIPLYSDIICGMRACLGLLKFAEGDGKLRGESLLLYIHGR